MRRLPSLGRIKTVKMNSHLSGSRSWHLLSEAGLILRDGEVFAGRLLLGSSDFEYRS